MMSHFLLIWQRDQHAILPKLQLEFRMSPRLPFAQAVERWHDGPIAAHISRDASDDYPVPFCHADGEHVVFFHGRLDYQDQLRRDLQMPMGSAPALLLAAYDKWGKVAFEKLYGSFVAVIYNTQHQSLLCVRDALGDCALYYYIDNATVVIALQPQMILAHPHVASTLNLKAVAHFLAGQSPNSAETIFQQVQQLPPAHTLRIDRQQTQQMRYWQLPAQQTCRLPSDAAYATQFREHLTNSVHNCTQVVSSFGVKMSGGLDSNALAALSAQTGAAPTTFSFVFNRFPHSNEARFIDATNAFLQLPHRQVVCDSQYPWSQLETWPLDPNHPFSDP
ncbi:MAG: asparagine synthase-related protein, partial [Candidatus Promineifilaceae bacterium]